MHALAGGAGGGSATSGVVRQQRRQASSGGSSGGGGGHRGTLSSAAAPRARGALGRGQMVCSAAAAAQAPLLRSIAESVASKQRSAVEVATAYLSALRSVEGQLHSFLAVDEQGVLAQAAAVDAAIARGDTAGPLAGVPVAVKDNICTANLATTAGSRALQGYAPPYDATAVAKLRAAGAVVLGKTNMDEFGMGSTTENSAYGPTRNPWDVAKVPGGSSGGSAAAVAARQAAAALGSDTGGSIRQPAHFCGVVGLKPSYGRVSRYGLVSYGSSLDAIGPLTHSVADAALLLSVMAGADAADATCSSEPVPDYLAALVPPEALPSSTPLKGKRFGVIEQTLGEGVAADVGDAIAAAVARLEALGAAVEQVSLPTFELGLPAYYVLALSEASSNLSRYDALRYGWRPDAASAAKDLKGLYGAARGEGFGPEVKRRVLMGTYALSAGYYDAYYKRAQQVRALVRREMDEALGKFDALVCPAAPTAAYGLGETADDPLAMYKGDVMTVNLNLAGLPAVVVPCAVTPAGLPVGLQLVGRMFGERELLAAAHVFETAGGGVVNGGGDADAWRPKVAAAGDAAAAAAGGSAGGGGQLVGAA